MQAGLADVPLARARRGDRRRWRVLGALAAYAVFGGLLPAVVTGGVRRDRSRSRPTGRRRHARRAAAMDAWPRLLEELRILTSSLGRSIPQALFEVGRRAPDELRPAFAAARAGVAAVDRLRPHARAC